MSVIGASVHGIAWSAIRMWAQMAVGALTFIVVASQLPPATIGAFGAMTLLLALVEASSTAPLAEALQQRRDLTPHQTDATFWIGLVLAILGWTTLTAAATPLAHTFGADAIAPLLPWAALGLVMSPAAAVMNALLNRDLRFGDTARAGLASGLASGLLTLVLVLTGAGLPGLVAADLAGRAIRLALLWRTCRYRPGPPRHLGAIAPLMRFNLATFATYWLGHADRIAPRLLAGLLLGPAALGYLMLGQRVLDLMVQLVVSPIGSVAMAAVARVQDDRAELQRLVLALYRLAALLGYPAFLGAIILIPDLARLLGPAWSPAVLPTQILLLVGLRLTTGAFNLPILRGLGRNAQPLALLGIGLLLNLVLTPLGAWFGPAGVAAAILARTLATWPLGCTMLRDATGLPIRAQLAPGLASAAAAAAMALLTATGLHLAPPGPPLLRLAAASAFGALTYAALLALAAPDAARAIAAAARDMLRGDRPRAAGTLRTTFGL